MWSIFDISFISGISCGLALGVAYSWFKNKSRGTTRTSNNQEQDDRDRAQIIDNNENGDYKLILVVRTDLKMGKGKIAAQCGHAAVGAYQQCRRKDPQSLRSWEATGQAKIAVKIDSEEAMLDIMQRAKKMGLITSIVRDAGRTQIAPNSKTVLAVGPGPTNLIDHVTGHLKLL